MPSSAEQNHAADAISRAGSAMAEGSGVFPARQQKYSSVASGDPDPSAGDAGWQELMILQKEWLGRHAELWQGMPSQPAAKRDRPTAKPEASETCSANPALGGSPMFDLLQRACQINPDYMKRAVEAVPVPEPVKDPIPVVTPKAPAARAVANVVATAAQATVSRYQEIRDKLKSGDIIVCCKGNMKSFKGFLSLLVRVVTASSYSHVGVVIKLGNRCFVVEATPPVVRLYPLSKLDSFYVIKMEQRLSREDENRLFEYVGLPYSDWNSIVSYFTRKPLANGKLQCAQLVSSFYNWPNLLRPEQIVRYAREDLGKQMVFVR